VILGPMLIILAGASATAALLTYALVGQRPAGARVARGLYAAMTILVIAASAYLMYLFIAHHFEFRYVHDYSSLDLPLKYTISSFWGGQEGTFLLWLLFGALLGWTIITRAKHYERWAMVYYLAVQIFLLVLLTVRSPFGPTGSAVADGRGLNPLLQNPWMVIHPPIVFLGFATLAIPFAYAMAALSTRDYASFPRLVFPWASLGVLTLGVGIFLGGYWAYKTLGWGGYWGWDPVENSSLIPWIIDLALVHGLLVQRRADKLIRTNLLLSILALLLVVYGTFLTRSGVLADFSVHSFTDLGINSYLVGFLVLVAVFGPGMLVLRARSIRTERLETRLTSREFGLAISILLLLTVGFLVFLGTSAPLLTRLFGEPANVAMSYYHSVSVPSGIVLLVLLLIIPFTLPGGTPNDDLLRKLAWPAVAAAIITIGAVLASNLHVEDLVLIFGGLWALGSNAYALVLLPRFTFARLGGHVSHLGFALMVLGIVASTNYDSSQRVNLVTGVPETALGYQIVYVSNVEKPRVEDSYLELELDHNGRKTIARPKLYYSNYTQSTMRSPHVVEGVFSDVYLSPLDLRTIEEPGGAALLELKKAEPMRYDDYTITFDGFEAGAHATDRITVGAKLTVVGPKDTVTITPQYESGPQGKVTSPDMPIPGTQVSVALARIMVESHSVQLRVNDPAKKAVAPGKEQLTLEVSRKPLISLVWLGVTIITLGALVSFANRWSQSNTTEA